MTISELKDRLERVEASMAHLERVVDQLNEALVDQGRHLARLQKRVEQVGENLEARDQAAHPMPIERPPHYGR